MTPDAFGDAWNGGSLSLEMQVELNGRSIGRLRTGGSEQHFDFPAIIAYAARTRSIGAGSIVGAGTVANQDEDRGAACLAEVRIMEQMRHGSPRTPWLAAGDRVRIVARDGAGETPFGVIDQVVAQV
ncbi:MAG: fumarylacetoacetate hydrolase family protein [Ramlibacter sp.]